MDLLPFLKKVIGARRLREVGLPARPRRGAM
jgi:hypothetical protein